MATRSATSTIVCLTGPESTGKTRLSLWLARRFHALHVPEYAREYLSARSTQSAYVEADVQAIGAGQRARELQALNERQAQQALICDTDVQVIETWWWFKYATATQRQRVGAQAPATVEYPSWLQKLHQAREPRSYLLLQPDVPWQADPLRESGGQREPLWQHYLALMQRDNLPYAIVSGLGAARYRRALQATARWLT